MLQCFITISIIRGTDFEGSRLAKWSDFNAVRLRKQLSFHPKLEAKGISNLSALPILIDFQIPPII
jgi:hypothetical protein